MPPPGYRYPQPRPVAPTGEPLAEFTDRLLARLIDGAILGAVGLVIAIPVFIAMFSMMTNRLDSTNPDVGPFILAVLGMYAVVLVLAVAAGYVYEVEMTYRTGQTIGKRVMKIRIVSLDGTPMTRGIAARRWVASNIAAIFIPLYSWIDGLWQLWDQPLRQCLHDKFAKTVVVKDARTGSA